MKANELRLGNWVNLPHGDVQIKYFIEIGAHFTDNNGGTFESLHPIPLTEEWLLKFGFMKHPIKTEYLHTKMGGLRIITYYGNNYLVKTIRGDAITSLKYVHQLQNLYFALTGEELEISNLKNEDYENNKI